MTVHLYEQFVAINSAGTRAAFAEFSAYAPADTSFTTPLDVFDAAGVPMATVDANGEGIVQPYGADGYLFIVLKSGDFIFPRVSAQGLVNEVTAAAAAATQALADLEQYILDHPAGSGGGSGIADWAEVAGLPGFPVGGFAQTGHTHVFDNLRKPDGSSLPQFMLDFLKATDAPAALAKIGGAAGTGTSNVTVNGTLSGAAMPASKQFHSDEIALPTGTVLAGADMAGVGNVEAALEKLANRTGTGATTAYPRIYRNGTTGTYATRATLGTIPVGTPAEWWGTVQPAFGTPYMETGDIWVPTATDS